LKTIGSLSEITTCRNMGEGGGKKALFEKAEREKGMF